MSRKYRRFAELDAREKAEARKMWRGVYSPNVPPLVNCYFNNNLTWIYFQNPNVPSVTSGAVSGFESSQTVHHA
jgi:hypothetical protein